MNAKIFLIFAVLLVYTVDAEVSSACENGSSYWCENYKQATECGALESCMKYVWKPHIGEFIFLCPPSTSKTLQKTTRPKNFVCATCKKVVAFLETLLQLNVSEVSIKVTIKSLCLLLQAEPQRKCLEAVDNFFNPIIELIRNKTKPGFICELIFLCLSSEVMAVEEAKGEWVCETCRQIINMMENPYWINRREAHVMFALTRGCSLLPKPEEAMCKKTVYVYKNSIMRMIRSRKNPKLICKILLFCTEPEQFRKTPRFNSGPYCALCKAGVRHAEQVYSAKRNEKMLRFVAVGTMCQRFPTRYIMKCKGMVYEYGEKIMYKLRQSQHPAVICQTLDLCVSDVKWMRSGCRNGEEYWCASFSNALQPKALKYCNHIRA